MKRALLLILGSLALIASVAMYFIGKDSSHLSELLDFFWVPLPLAIVSFIAAFMVKK